MVQPGDLTPAESVASGVPTAASPAAEGGSSVTVLLIAGLVGGACVLAALAGLALSVRREVVRLRRALDLMQAELDGDVNAALDEVESSLFAALAAEFDREDQ